MKIHRSKPLSLKFVRLEWQSRYHTKNSSKVTENTSHKKADKSSLLPSHISNRNSAENLPPRSTHLQNETPDSQNIWLRSKLKQRINHLLCLSQKFFTPSDFFHQDRAQHQWGFKVHSSKPDTVNMVWLFSVQNIWAGSPRWGRQAGAGGWGHLALTDSLFSFPASAKLEPGWQWPPGSRGNLPSCSILKWGSFLHRWNPVFKTKSKANLKLLRGQDFSHNNLLHTKEPNSLLPRGFCTAPPSSVAVTSFQVPNCKLNKNNRKHWIWYI